MAAKKTPPKNTQKQPAQNTSAPKAAEVSLPAGEQSPAQDATQQLAPQAVIGLVETPPSGDGAQLIGDHAGELLAQGILVAESITVVAHVEGFRRAGRAWSRTPTTVPLEDFDESQLEALWGEPMLYVAFNGSEKEKVGA